MPSRPGRTSTGIASLPVRLGVRSRRHLDHITAIGRQHQRMAALHRLAPHAATVQNAGRVLFRQPEGHPHPVILHQVLTGLVHPRRTVRQIVRIAGHHVRPAAREQHIGRLRRRPAKRTDYRRGRQLQHAAHVEEGLDDGRVAHHRLVALGVGNQPADALVGKHPAGHIRAGRNRAVRKLQQHHLQPVHPADHRQVVGLQQLEGIRVQMHLATQMHIQRNTGTRERITVFLVHRAQRGQPVVEHAGIDVRCQHRRLHPVRDRCLRERQRVFHGTCAVIHPRQQMAMQINHHLPSSTANPTLSSTNTVSVPVPVVPGRNAGACHALPEHLHQTTAPGGTPAFHMPATAPAGAPTLHTPAAAPAPAGSHGAGSTRAQEYTAAAASCAHPSNMVAMAAKCKNRPGAGRTDMHGQSRWQLRRTGWARRPVSARHRRAPGEGACPAPDTCAGYCTAS